MNTELKDNIVDYLGFLPPWDETFFYSSKKNSVARYKDVIFKFFCFGDKNREADIYRKCIDNGIPVPELLGEYNNTLVLKYIKEDREIDPLRKFSQTLKWLKDFHLKTGISKGDQRLFNYIFNQDRIYGIDFEEAGDTSIEYDIASIIVTGFNMFSEEVVIGVLEKENYVINTEIKKLIEQEKLKRKLFVKNNSL